MLWILVLSIIDLLLLLLAILFDRISSAERTQCPQSVILAHMAPFRIQSGSSQLGSVQKLTLGIHIVWFRCSSVWILSESTRRSIFGARD